MPPCNVYGVECVDAVSLAPFFQVRCFVSQCHRQLAKTLVSAAHRDVQNAWLQRNILCATTDTAGPAVTKANTPTPHVAPTGSVDASSASGSVQPEGAHTGGTGTGTGTGGQQRHILPKNIVLRRSPLTGTDLFSVLPDELIVKVLGHVASYRAMCALAKVMPPPPHG